MRGKTQQNVLEASVTSLDKSRCKAADQTQSLKAIPQIPRAHLWGSVATSSLAPAERKAPQTGKQGCSLADGREEP